MSAVEHQITLEAEAVRRGIQRYQDSLAAEQARGREWEGSAGQRFITQRMEEFVPAVRALQRRARQAVKLEMSRADRAVGSWEEALCAMSPLQAAYITLRTALSVPDARRHMMGMSVRVGAVCNMQVRWDAAKHAEASRAKGSPDIKNRIYLLKLRSKTVSPSQVQAWLRRLSDLEIKRWSKTVQISMGSALLEALCAACPDTFKRAIPFVPGKRQRVTMCLTEEAQAELAHSHNWYEALRPWYLPMVAPPRPWVWDDEAKEYTGGYYRMDCAIVKGHGRWGHTADELEEGGIPDVVLDALNLVSETRWRINKGVLGVARRAADYKVAAVLPVAPLVEVPPRVPDAEWEPMDKDARRDVMTRRRKIHINNLGLAGKREAMYRQLSVATEFMESEWPIYFPHDLDFRGRVYPIPQDLHPQADDMARSLLTFYDVKPLGETGVYYLMRHIANTWGEDKVSQGDQIDWVIRNSTNIQIAARCPLDKMILTWWAEADKPWQFLAACKEYAAALADPGGPTAYPSSLPVQVDGSCNGLQHLSAMARDPIGAHATNLTDDPERQDVYQIVADKVVAMVEADDCEEAGNWLGSVTRKTVKRAVMTVPYGVTDIGMRDQLIADKWTTEIEGDPVRNASYLRDRLKDGISDTIVSAREVMGWIQANTRILAKEDKAFVWYTPAGFKVTMAYYKPTRQQVRTVAGTGAVRKINFRVADRHGGLKIKKQVLASAPNVIHSFDAAHLTLTIASAADQGVSSFSVIHDSYGTHACDMDTLGNALRGAFAEIYEQDWLASLQEDFEACAGPDIRLVPPPDIGDFDVRQVVQSCYFFA